MTETTEVTFDQELDCQGMLCPLPILKTKKVMDTMNAGEVLKMLSTDAGSVNDINAWTRQTGNDLVFATANEGLYTYFLRKS
ncbi:MAG: sulfurtransferase TusA family protein [Candidatus Marinimicrobia bacterium]|nr:sulfurtransferase TusA family protein [Candidatus Neomarinimicrobiota bacterium]